MDEWLDMDLALGKEEMMPRSAKTIGWTALTAAVAAVLTSFAIPGCVDQNQDNSPISVSNSQGRPALSVTCSADGSVAYVTDGRNVYRHDRNASGAVESWVCILSQGERLEMAAKHDPREQPPSDGTQEKGDSTKSEGKG